MRCGKGLLLTINSKSYYWKQWKNTHVSSAIWVHFTRVRPTACLHLVPIAWLHRLRNQQTRGESWLHSSASSVEKIYLFSTNFWQKPEWFFAVDLSCVIASEYVSGNLVNKIALCQGNLGILYCVLICMYGSTASPVTCSWHLIFKSNPWKKSCGFGEKISMKW